tara:strand:- start:736 stop:960 length:225 start_codon:yes stop_codon:yes gene_type:complete
LGKTSANGLNNNPKSGMESVWTRDILSPSPYELFARSGNWRNEEFLKKFHPNQWVSKSLLDTPDMNQSIFVKLK